MLPFFFTFFVCAFLMCKIMQILRLLNSVFNVHHVRMYCICKCIFFSGFYVMSVLENYR